MAKLMVHRLLIFLWLAVAVVDAASSTPEGPSVPTTAGPGVPTSADPSGPTTAGPGVPTTAGPGGPTTAGPAVPTTGGPAVPTTAGPAVPTTAGPAVPTTAGPGVPTTAGPGVPTTAGPGVPTTADPAVPTTGGPGVPTTAGPGVPTTAGPGVPTTAGPGVPTTVGPGVPTTADPGVPTTAGPGVPTTAGPGVPTTVGPGVPTTADPGVPTTAGPGVLTTAGPGVLTTAGPGVPTTADPSDPCYPNPCGTGITCEARFNESFTCLCLAGQNYMKEEKRCADAKVFPGFISLNLEYHENMQNKTSEQFQNASLQIIKALEEVFNSTEYLTSTVLDIRSTQDQKFSSLRNKRNVNASVENIFKSNAEITEKDIENKIKEAGEDCESADCLLKGAVFIPTDLCNKKPCDEKTADCSSDNGIFTCSCETGYIKTNFSSRICIACPSGQKEEDHSNCVPCPYGYSGLNCSESWKLVLVIIGSLFGGLLIITLIALTVVACKPSKKSSKKRADTSIGNAYITHSPAKAPLMNGSSASSQVSNASAGVPRIPRATTTNSWDRSSNLEMTPSSSRQNLVPDRNLQMYEDDLHPQNRAQTNPYSQNRAQTNPYPQNGVQTNPYAQNRAQTNPYAQSRGQINPYYTHDDGGRLN